MDVQYQIRHQAMQNTAALGEIRDFVDRIGERDRRTSEEAKAFELESVRLPPIRGEGPPAAEASRGGYTADDYREAGNKLFKAGDVRTALRYYEKAAAMGAGQAAALGNAGLCHLRLKNEQKALDCFNRALELDPRYLKVLVRRGRLLGEMGSFEASLRDFTLALELSPAERRGEVEADIRKVRAEWEAELARRAQQAEREPSGSGAAERRGEAGRVEIEIEADEGPADGAGVRLAVEIEEESGGEQAGEGDAEGGREGAAEPGDVPTAGGEPSALPVSAGAEGARGVGEPQAASEAAGASSVLATSAASAAASSPSPQAPPAPPASSVPSAPSASPVPPVPPPPANSSAFFADVKALSARPEALADYLNGFHTSKVPALLSSQFTESELAAIVAAASAGRMSPKKAVNTLFATLSLPKFDLIEQFLSPETRARIAALLEDLRPALQADPVSAGRAAQVAASYRLGSPAE